MTTRKIGKILFINHNIAPFEPSGTPITTANQARALQASGYDVSVVVPDVSVDRFSRRVLHDGLLIHKIPRLNFFTCFLSTVGKSELSFYLKEFWTLIQRLEPDVVHINDYVGMPREVLFVLKKAGALIVRGVCNDEEICPNISPYIVKPDGVDLCVGPHDLHQCAAHVASIVGEEGKVPSPRLVHDLAKTLETTRTLYAGVFDGVVFTTREFRNHFIQHVAIAKEKVRIIERGITLPFPRVTDRTIPDLSRGVSFAFVGEISYRKGADVVLAAFESLARERIFELHLFGYVSNKTIETRIWQIEERYRGRFFFHGEFERESLQELLSRIHVCIVPSVFESFNRMVREILWLGIPSIVTEFFGSSIIDHGVNGYRIPVGDHDALAHNMKILIDNPSIIDELALGATRTRITSVAEEVDAIVEFYKELKRVRESK
jgi:glycosyltransferase involved in cell wall biosynthesis